MEIQVNSAFAKDYKSLENNILNKLKHIKLDDESLKKLKFHFVNQINSKRTFERINKFDQLFNVLKKRNIIDHNKIESFNFALDAIQKKELSREENCNLEKEFLNLFITNSYVTANTSTFIEHDLEITKNIAILSQQNCESDLCKKRNFQQKVMLEISDRIGIKWRNLARYLGITEMIIDQTEIKYSDLKEKAYQILRMSQEQLTFENWRRKLIYALDKVRRRDLCDWIEDIYLKSY
ncbi:uncharacterized protein LOC127290038 [Leptopilina boulardi]|uniref:uncharacterized protein LOC127290038 n=1 Tax=Leptopilina boulardi TaxID=63433 RepID=UPI0021F52A0D|nr:uncharacterized protein LOC127290038 [Leptopilina boulardi]